jgi:hypothetical protein
MIQFLVLILVAVLITASVEAISKLKDYIVLKDWELFKIGVPASWLLAIASVLTLNIGLTQTILEVVQIDVVLPQAFHFVDLFMTTAIVSQGAGSIIDVLTKFKELKEMK